MNTPTPTPNLPESVVTWHPGNTVPKVPKGDEQYFLVAVRRKHELGKVWSFPAQFLNNKMLLCNDDEPSSRKGNGWCQVPCEEGEDADILVTGWHMESSAPDGEYDSSYRPLLSDGDELMAWAEIPQYAADSVRAANARAEGVDAISAILAKHSELLESRPHAYFELAYTRATDWMVFMREGRMSEGRMVANGQGLTPGEACQSALDSIPKYAAQSVRSEASEGDNDGR